MPHVVLLLTSSIALGADLPAFSVERGVFDAPFDLTLTPSLTTDTLYCSTDRSEPTARCAAGLTVSATTTLRVRALGADGVWSPTTTQTYLFPTDILTQARMDPGIVQSDEYGPILDESLRTSPSISIVLPGPMSETEQAISLEWIDPAGADPSDSSQVNCGANIIGGTSQVYEKTTFRLHFRSQYGASKWEFDIYGDTPVGVTPATQFDALSLRSGNHDSLFYLGTAGQYTRNYWMDETQLEMGHLAPHGKYVQLYVNGSYNGQYHVRERFDAGFMASYLGGEEEDYDAVNGGSVFDGTSTAWNQLVTYASVGDYVGVQSLLNVENFLDYMVLNWYAANSWDWSPDHNWIAAGPSEPNQGGFIFHSSDSDICLYYAPNTNILSNAGPSYLYQYLITSRDPEFMVALADAIHRNLESGGPLTSARSTERYARIAGLAEDGVIGDSARFGYGGWSRDGDWIPQRDWLLNVFFVLRTSNLLGQVRAAGWYPLDAPNFDTIGGLVPVGTVVVADAPASSTGDLWVTTDGSDPRSEDGTVSPMATGPSRSQAITLVHGSLLQARILRDGTWGPVESAEFDVDEAAPLVLNEWSAVEPGEVLDDGDSALGTVDGNGGDWIELLVVEDHLDIRGWSIRMRDRHQVDWTLTFTDQPLLEDLRAGTIVTLAEDLPEDAAYDPETGDWRFHLRVTEDGAYVRPTGVVSATGGFEVTATDWQAQIVDADGWTRASPVGEGVNGLAGLGSDEAGQLAETPGAEFRPWTGSYRASNGSTFGSPNRWSDGEQDLSDLRGETSTIHDIGDTGAAPGDSADPPRGGPEGGAGCGCGTGTGPSGLLLLLAGLAARLRSRPALVALGVPLVPMALLALLPGCTGASSPTDDSSSGPAGTEPNPDASCFRDLDQDGYGSPDAAIACGGAASANDADCDDSLSSVHPGASETCNDVDDDCDGAIDEEPVDGLPFYADGDGDGYGTDVATACTLLEGYSLAGSDCDDSNPAIHPGATEACDTIDDDCDGIASDSLGSTSACPASTCLDAAQNGVTEDGSTWITLPFGEVAPVWCDQTTDGGGWTLAFVRNTAATDSQANFGEGNVSTAALADSAANASSASGGAMGWLDLNAYSYDTLRLAAYSNSSETYLSSDIPRSELRIAFGEDGYQLYGGATGYYWCGGDRNYTDYGVGAINNPAGAPPDCKAHGSLGSGWDFSQSGYANQGLTLCGGDGSYFLSASWAGSYSYYGTAGGAQAIWVR